LRCKVLLNYKFCPGSDKNCQAVFCDEHPPGAFRRTITSNPIIVGIGKSAKNLKAKIEYDPMGLDAIGSYPLFF